MSRFQWALSGFEASQGRADEMITLSRSLKAIKADDEICRDALRSAWVLSVSALDFLLHELIVVEVVHRLKISKSVDKTTIPFSCLLKKDEEMVLAVENHIRTSNSYKSFIDPNKLSEAMGAFVEHPWQKIRNIYENLHGEFFSERDIKIKLSAIYKRRNQIAHEADLNPALSYSSTYDIDDDDAEACVNFVRRLGHAIVKVLES